MSDMLTLINATRVMHNRKRLKRGWLLEAYAVSHSRKMARKHSLEHGDLQGYLISKHAWSYWGENVGVTTADQQDPILALHRAFLASPAHRENVLRKPFRKCGIGYHNDGTAVWCTVTFRA